MNPLESYETSVYRLAFATFKNINLETARCFASKHIGEREFFTLEASELSRLSGLKAAFFADSRRNEALESARRELDFIEKHGIKATYYDDIDYPSRLLECCDAPAVLFSLGTVPQHAEHTVAIVGTRHCTSYGADFTRRLVSDLSQMLDDLTIISGLAYGIDISAHRAALKSGVPTGAVLAHGLNTIYPADHRKDARRIISENGFITTEYRSCDTIHRGNFLARNRIVAGLSDVTVVVESDTKGGAMSTARIAGAYNREVMALPGRVGDTYSRGCNALIASNTASLIRDAQDLVDLMGWTARTKEGQQNELPFLTAEQSRVLEHLSAHPQCTVNDMTVALGLPYATLSSILFTLEMEDLVANLPGNRYVPVNKTR